MLKAVYHMLSGMLAKKKLHFIKGLNYLGRETSIPLTAYDYLRVATLELLSQEIKTNKVEGDVAELGVYKGGFAKYINAVFADRNLYLFDTFTGFDEMDKAKDLEHGQLNVEQDFSNTSVQKVISLMKYPEKCIVRKGRFPGTADGPDQVKFAFVSIDADLYQPILAGLHFFYSNLSPGGYIMVHDYNNMHYPGAGKAVNEFCKLHRIAFVPIPDSGGTVVINKPD